MLAARILRNSLPGLAVAVAMLWAGACDDTAPPSEPDTTSPENEVPSLSSLIVSNPVASATGANVGLFVNQSSSNDNVVFISLPPGSVPNGERVFIRTRETGAEATTVMVDGGFDPIPIAATAGDMLDVQIDLEGGELEEFVTEVPPSRPPVVVRTDPPPQRRDVPLNAVMQVVFSEPIDAATLTPSSVQLLLDGVSVDGTLDFGDDMNLAATFAPSEPLAAGAEYTLLVTQDIEDLDGDALDVPATVDFTTASEAEAPAEPTDPSSPDEAILKVSGDGQEAEVGTWLREPLTVRVIDEQGNALEGIEVTWVVDRGVAGLSSAEGSETIHVSVVPFLTGVTDAEGMAAMQLAPFTPGPISIRVFTDGVGWTIFNFTAEGTPRELPFSSEESLVYERLSHSGTDIDFHEGSLSSRYVLHGDGTFGLQYESGRWGFFEYLGSYSLFEGDDAAVLVFSFDASSRAGEWQAAGVADGDGCVTVGYNLVMGLSDFENGQYCVSGDT